MRKMIQKSTVESSLKKTKAPVRKVVNKTAKAKVVTPGNGLSDSASKNKPVETKPTERRNEDEDDIETEPVITAESIISKDETERNDIVGNSESVQDNAKVDKKKKIVNFKQGIKAKKLIKGTDDAQNNNMEGDEVEAESIVMHKTESKAMKKTQKSLKRKSDLLRTSEKTAQSSQTKEKRLKVTMKVPPLKSISGKVFVIGENDMGQLGLGEDVEVKKRPALLELPQSVVDIAAGGMHSLCLTESGEVITFGCNDEGALGRITSEEGSEYIPRKVDIPERVVQVSCGDSHSAALSESGQVYIWGNFRNNSGAMGLTVAREKQIKPMKILNNVTVVRISSGSEHFVCLTDEGMVYTSGCGEAGQLGRLPERKCADGGRDGLAALLEPGVVHISKPSKPVIIDDVWTGSYATFLKAKESGLIYAFGLNNYNHLGYENETVLFRPTQIPSFNNKTWLQINGGQHHTLALDNNGLVYALGREHYGRLGLGENCNGTSVPTVIPTLENEKSVHISCGNCVSFAVSEQGAVYSFGFGTNHQLGHGDDEDCHEPRCISGNFLASWKAIKVSGGGQHTLILASPNETAKEKDS